MNPACFHELAESLIAAAGSTSPFQATQDKRAECRSAISRAYYAVFNRARELLPIFGLEANKDASAHKGIAYLFNNSGDTLLSSVSTLLDQLRSHRNNADYNLSLPDPGICSFATTRVVEAKRALALIDQIRRSCEDEFTLNKLTSAMRDYFNKIKPNGISLRTGRR